MKTSHDPRHLERIKIIQELFAWEFSKENRLTSNSVSKIVKHLKKIDSEIVEAAPSWPLEKINKLDLAILRLAVFELLIEPNTPPKVVVDEAVELAKEYGSESSASFINGALGKLITGHKITT
jgi:transcription antitermination protein NusB